ncbi:hypothetical protein [Blautia sp. An46]|uniref:Uncharacterized protein n=1 Tax=Candidatus Blautia pullistercoris TaxID=2838499 RepID=A0A9D1VLB3_9FIRM|nr:hypothetical protein [Blautia sp. An46]MBS6679095.1 hypothetical protein [Clostridiales bacterium]HIX37163.1 hypothetical protein [Candidatus Blautia pullistercoris]
MGKTEIQCGMDSSGKCGESYYLRVLQMLESYFHDQHWKTLFLKGGCYWLAELLHQGIRDSKIVINRVEEHCAVAFNHGIYDVTGRISGKNFHIASPREISFMKKNYIPQFNTEKLERYLKML